MRAVGERGSPRPRPSKRHRRQHRTEHLLLRQRVVGRHVAEQRRLDVKAAGRRVRRDLALAPAISSRSLVRCARKPLDPLQLLRGISGPQSRSRLGRRRRRARGSARRRCRRTRRRRGPRPAGASRPSTSGRRSGSMALTDERQRRVEIGIGEHDLRRLAAELQRAPGSVRWRRPAGPARPASARAGERDVVDAGMRGERCARLVAVAGDDVERARPAGRPRRELARRAARDRQASSAGLTTQALPMASAAPTLRPKICIG